MDINKLFETTVAELERQERVLADVCARVPGLLAQILSLPAPGEL